MIKMEPKAKVVFSLELTLDEPAARALEAMAGYGANAFLAVFYEKLGKAYMKPHEAGLRSLLALIQEQLPSQLLAVTHARSVIKAHCRTAVPEGPTP